MKKYDQKMQLRYTAHTTAMKASFIYSFMFVNFTKMFPGSIIIILLQGTQLNQKSFTNVIDYFLLFLPK